jgi:uncharacterized membrane-anchored protein
LIVDLKNLVYLPLKNPLNRKKMKKTTISILLFLGVILSNYAQSKDTVKAVVDYEKIEASFKYEKGKIKLTSGNGVLNVPKGFGFLDAKQAQYVIKDLWGNPEDPNLLGAIVPEGKGITYSDSWLFTITYDPMGYVKDDDAKDVDYDDLLKEIQEDFKTNNPDRVKQGYPTMDLVGWASKPFYDQDKKVLHWAKEIKFGKDSINTLNYDLRVLGRKGVYILQAVSSMKQLPEVKSNISKIISSVEFEQGDKYANFDSSTDNVAAWTIGGLVGKVLAKVGFFAIILKFWKIGMIALAGGWAAIKKFMFGKKDQETSRPVSDDHDVSSNEE